MTSTITINGTRVARGIRARAAEEVTRLTAHGTMPGPAMILVGDDPASAVYVAARRRAVREAGIHRTAGGLPGDARTAELRGVAGRITPVPGGVGPMTIAVLLANTVQAAAWDTRRDPVPA
jgi:5,10-methylene-tetrahydrofolate dehydrogenase/methenyl tetrahydrofolate cyclohydrolase